MADVPGSPSAHSDEIAAVLRGSRSSFMAVALFSGLLNVLALTGSLYMLQVYDRVIPSRSVPTLVWLTILMTGLYVGYGLIDPGHGSRTSQAGRARWLKHAKIGGPLLFLFGIGLTVRALSWG